MFPFPQKSQLSQKDGTQTRFLVARPVCVFHFFVFLTIASFLFWTISPAALAQGNATSTEEIVNNESLIIDDYANATSTLETATNTAEIATSTEEIINDETLDEKMENEEVANVESLVEIEFTNVYYGEVAENRQMVADQITNATIRNVGDVPAAIMIWQDDMGLGRAFGGDWNIQYGARVAGGEWIFYDPYEMMIMPDVLAPGQVAEMEFSVKVSNFSAEQKTDYQGIMTINGIAAPQGQESLPFLNNILSDDSDLKSEAETESGIPNSGGESLL